MTRLRCVLALAAAGAIVAGCSQAAALSPVGGNRLSEVRFAAIDVLTAHQVEIMVAPVCVRSGPDQKDIICTGTTVDNQTITASSLSTDQDDMKLTVGAQTLYSGPFLTVLTENAQATS